MRVSLPDIYESFVKLSAPLTEDATYPVILEEACNLVNAEYGSLFLADSHQRLKRVYSTSPAELQFDPRPKGYCYTCFNDQKSLVVQADNITKAHPEFHSSQAKLVVMIPLGYEGVPMGVLTLDSVSRTKFSKRKLQIIELFGNLVSMKIRNISLISKMKQALETRDLFISMASHELKTPLTTISAYAQLIDKKMGQNQPVSSNWSKTMISATARMTRLINELLQINQIRTGNLPYHFRICSLDEIIETAAVDFRVSHPQMTLKVNNALKTSDEVFADEERLSQVINNLLNNSVKFSPIDKPILLQASKKANKVVISVIDQGLGISKADQHKLFEEFYKVKANTKEGLGLGLYISKKIIEEHKGSISIKSSLGKGTQVDVFLPQIHYG